MSGSPVPATLRTVFGPGSQTRVLVKNTVWLAAGDGAIRLVKIALTVYAIRALGRLAYGQFAFAFVSLFSTLFDFGLSRIMTRGFSNRQDEQRAKMVERALALGRANSWDAMADRFSRLFAELTGPEVAAR